MEPLHLKCLFSCAWAPEGESESWNISTPSISTSSFIASWNSYEWMSKGWVSTSGMLDSEWLPGTGLCCSMVKRDCSRAVGMFQATILWCLDFLRLQWHMKNSVQYWTQQLPESSTREHNGTLWNVFSEPVHCNKAFSITPVWAVEVNVCIGGEKRLVKTLENLEKSTEHVHLSKPDEQRKGHHSPAKMITTEKGKTWIEALHGMCTSVG